MTTTTEQATTTDTPALPCPGACNREYRQSINTYNAAMTLHRAAVAADPETKHPQPERPRIQPLLGDPLWCTGCAKQIKDAIHDFLELYVRLDCDKHRATTPPSERTTGTRCRPSPSPAADTQDQLMNDLRQWEDTVRWRRGFNDAPKHQPGRVMIGPLQPGEARRNITATNEGATLTGSVQFLLKHLTWILEDKQISRAFGTSILRTHENLRARTNSAEPSKQWQQRRCPRCQLKTLARPTGADYVQCANPKCNRHMSLTEYEELTTQTRQTAREQERISA